MNLEPGKNEGKATPPAKPTVSGALKTIPKRLWRALMHNPFWKLLAVFLAVCLWALLIAQDPTLTRERTFTDVHVSVYGSDTLRRNGLIILSDMNDELLSVRLRADVPQREYNTVSAGNFSPRIDLSRITDTGIQAVRITTTSTTAYGTVLELIPDSIEVLVDEYYTIYRVPVSIERLGQYPKGFYGAMPSLDPSSVTVSGPKSIVIQIARAIVDFTVSRLPAQAGLTRTALPMRFVDVNGDPVESNLIDVTSAGVLLNSVTAEQTLYATKTLPISSLALTSGKPAKGYEIKSVTATPNILVAAGDEIGLAALDSLFLEKAVDVTGKDETFTVEVDIRQPSELVYLSSKSITLTVEIGPVISSRRFDNLKFSFMDKMEKRTIRSDLKTVSVTLTGPTLFLTALRPSALSAYADVTGLAAGEHELPIFLDILDENQQKFTYDITPKLVQFRIEGD